MPLPLLLLPLLLLHLPSALMQANPAGNAYRPLGNYPPVAEPTEPQLEYLIEKMPDASYNWQLVSAGGRHTCGIKSGTGFADGKDYTGKLFCFGRNEEKQCSLPKDVEDAQWSVVSAGWKTTCGATTTAKWRVRCFGDDSSGIVSKAPTLPQTWTVNSISVGDQHACAIVVNSARQSAAAASASVIGNSTRKTLVGGNVTCWGDDKFGRVTGKYAEGAEYVADLFPAALQGRFAQVCAASSHTCALETTGSIWCWGNNMLDRAKVPESLRNVVWQSVTCNGAHTCAIDINGWPACWGYGVHGQLEMFLTQYDNTGKKQDSEPQPFSSISAGRTHTCGIVILPSSKLKCSEQGTANTVSINGMCFGDITYGQVVSQKGNPYGVPMKPPFTQDRITERCYVHQFSQMSAGGYHTCGISVKDGNDRNQMICWGLADDGQTVPYYPGAGASNARAWAAAVVTVLLTALL